MLHTLRGETERGKDRVRESVRERKRNTTDNSGAMWGSRSLNVVEVWQQKGERHHVSYRWTCFPYKVTFFCSWEEYGMLWENVLKKTIHPSIRPSVHLSFGRAISSTHSLTHSFTHSVTHTQGQFRGSSQPKMHVSGLWEETGVAGENPTRHRQNTQTLHRKTPPRKKCHRSEAWS